MKNLVRFTKMHGAGNDYIYVDTSLYDVPEPEKTAMTLSDRHTGIGADGLVLIGRPSDTTDADFTMRIFNADGSEGKMCGNGSRCVAKYVHDKDIVKGTRVELETLSGIKTIDLQTGPDGKATGATVDMGAPVLTAREIPAIAPEDEIREMPVATSFGPVELTAVSMGNPHGVIFFDDLDSVDVHRLGRELETHAMWPDRANIEMAQKIDGHTVRMRVWERGSGETMACGTGACATAVAAVLTGRCTWPVTVRLLGGDLIIDKNKDNGHIMMTGPAETVFEGTYLRS